MIKSGRSTSLAASLKTKPLLKPSIKPCKVRSLKTSSQHRPNGRKSPQWWILISRAATKLWMTTTESSNMSRMSSLGPMPRITSRRWSRRTRNGLKAPKQERSNNGKTANILCPGSLLLWQLSTWVLPLQINNHKTMQSWQMALTEIHMRQPSSWLDGTMALLRKTRETIS